MNVPVRAPIPVAETKFLNGSPWVHVFSSAREPAAAEGMPLRKPSTPLASPWATIRLDRDALVASLASGPIGMPLDTRIGVADAGGQHGEDDVDRAADDVDEDLLVGVRRPFDRQLGDDGGLGGGQCAEGSRDHGPAAPNVRAVTATPATIAAIIAHRSATASTARRCSSTSASTFFTPWLTSQA